MCVGHVATGGVDCWPTRQSGAWLTFERPSIVCLSGGFSVLLADVKLVSAALYSDEGHATPHIRVIRLHVWNVGAKSIVRVSLILMKIFFLLGPQAQPW